MCEVNQLLWLNFKNSLKYVFYKFLKKKQFLNVSIKDIAYEEQNFIYKNNKMPGRYKSK